MSVSSLYGRVSTGIGANYPLTAKNYRLYNKMEITFSKQELIDLFKLAKEENIPTHLNNTIKNIKSNGLQNLINMLEQETISLQLFNKLKLASETNQYKIL